ncbi:hypothetical protein BOX15_Mlig030438g2 [Macrostomum lignano]|uniref:Uncharacterized protein n=2 Tax=Macrostomum lignano TaxID=282301 RepID=A0A267GH75_9PLAT|nr:hypothetical protein BOX15_Mlig030438g2 [Macrostomum lignano]
MAAVVSGVVPFIILTVFGGVLTTAVVVGVVAVRRHRRRKLQDSVKAATAPTLDFELQPVDLGDSSSSSDQRVTPPGLELDLDSEDAQADLADVAVAKATCHLCGGFFCSVPGSCSSAAAVATAASNVDNSASNSGDDFDDTDAALRRLRACRVRGEIKVTAADVEFRRGLASDGIGSRLSFSGGEKDVAESDDDCYKRDCDVDAAASYFFHRGVQPPEHQLVERVPSSGVASLAALPGHDYRLWRCPAHHAAKSLLCHRCRPLLSFHLTPRRENCGNVDGGGGEILFDHRRSGRRVWIASTAYAGPLSCLVRLPLPPSTSCTGGVGSDYQTVVIQFGAEVPDNDENNDAGLDLAAIEPSSAKRFEAFQQAVWMKQKAPASAASERVEAVNELNSKQPQQISASNHHLCRSEEVSADADTEPDTGNDDNNSDDEDVFTTAASAAAAASVAPTASTVAITAAAMSIDTTMSDCDAASTSTVSAQTEWSSLRKRAAASAATKWAAISMQEVADQLESSSSPGVDEFLPGSRSPADGSSIELATVSAGDTGDAVRGSVGVEDPMAAASALSAARAAADAVTQFAALGDLCAGKVGAGVGTDAEYLRFLYSSDASSSGGGCGDGDSEGSDTGEPAATGAAAAATRTSRRSSTDFYSADSTLTSRCDSSQSEAPPAE